MRLFSLFHLLFHFSFPLPPLVFLSLSYLSLSLLLASLFSHFIVSNHSFAFLFLLVDIDDCSKNPCKNGGSCLDGVNSYQCVCVAGYTGPSCEISKCSHQEWIRSSTENG